MSITFNIILFTNFKFFLLMRIINPKEEYLQRLVGMVKTKKTNFDKLFILRDVLAWELSGNRKKDLRQDLVSKWVGKKLPKAKCGINFMQELVITYLKEEGIIN